MAASLRRLLLAKSKRWGVSPSCCCWRKQTNGARLKAYGAYVRIIAREGQDLLDLAERLTAKTLRLPPEHEWSAFVERDPQMVDPRVALREVEEIEYPGRRHPAVTVVQSGMLERKSKYLKSFTPAWYVIFALAYSGGH